jgi:arsenate reductase
MRVEKRQPLKVLFVCVGNAARSQMAEGFLRQLGGDRFQISSAGLMPHWRVDPQAIVAMRAVGVDISAQEPKGLEAVDVADQDVVVALCDAPDDLCPSGFRGELRHWGIEDPHGRPMEIYRLVRDEIKQRVGELVREFGGKNRIENRGLSSPQLGR